MKSSGEKTKKKTAVRIEIPDSFIKQTDIVYRISQDFASVPDGLSKSFFVSFSSGYVNEPRALMVHAAGMFGRKRFAFLNTCACPTDRTDKRFGLVDGFYFVVVISSKPSPPQRAARKSYFT